MVYIKYWLNSKVIVFVGFFISFVFFSVIQKEKTELYNYVFTTPLEDAFPTDLKNDSEYFDPNLDNFYKSENYKGNGLRGGEADREAYLSCLGQVIENQQKPLKNLKI